MTIDLAPLASIIGPIHPDDPRDGLHPQDAP